MLAEQPDTPAHDGGWSWDPSLYSGSAAFYVTGRVAYPPEVAAALVRELGLNGSGTLLDVGCGPGSLTLLIAPYFAEAIGIDADQQMLEAAAVQANARSLGNVSWRHMRAEDLPADLAPVNLITFAQSFHWMDRPRVAAAARILLAPDGALVHVHATTHQGVESNDPLPYPQPPRQAINKLVEKYLGPVRRAGQGILPAGTPGNEDDIYRAAGFDGPHSIELAGWVMNRSLDEIAASVYSLSNSAPHLFGNHLRQFDEDLRALLHRSNSSGHFSEQMRPVALHIWR